MKAAIVVAALLLPTAASASSNELPAMVREPAAEAVVAPFLAALQSGKTDGAVAKLLATSPIWQNKTLELQNMQNQVVSAVQLYGPIERFELIESRRLGTSVIRQYYIARHAKMATRWEFDLAATSTGWAVAYFGFDDQVRTWF